MLIFQILVFSLSFFIFVFKLFFNVIVLRTQISTFIIPRAIDDICCRWTLAQQGKQETQPSLSLLCLTWPRYLALLCPCTFSASCSLIVVQRLKLHVGRTSLLRDMSAQQQLTTAEASVQGAACSRTPNRSRHQVLQH